MKSSLNIALVQTDLIWENPEKNRTMLEKKLAKINDADVIVLPEMFTSGFTMNANNVAEKMDGDSVNWMIRLSKSLNAALLGSLVIKENNQFFNRLICVKPNGNIMSYDKRHTFTLAGEDKVYTAGNKKTIITINGWKICPLICYDLRFPVWSRNTDDYDALIYVANWPEIRITAWDTLLRARAIENMAYCIGVNRVGKDNNNYNYSGNSAAFDTIGNRLDSIKPNDNTIQVVTLEKSHIEKYRNKLGFLNDKDDFEISLTEENQ